MSIDIRHYTNGIITRYVVFHTDTGEREYYKERSSIPKSIRDYAPLGRPRAILGPDLARCNHTINMFYPKFPPCHHPEYEGKACIAESCKYAPNHNYTKCRYFDKTYDLKTALDECAEYIEANTK